MGQLQLFHVGPESVWIRRGGFVCVVHRVQRIILVQKEFI